MHQGTQSNPVGLWIFGAAGDIATTLMIGARAIARGRVSTTGLVTELPPFSSLGCFPLADLRIGGLDIAQTPIPHRAERLYRESRTLSRETLDAVTPDLREIDADVLVDPDLTWNPQDPGADLPPLTDLITRLRGQLDAFRERHGIGTLVAVNLISAGPEPGESALHGTLAGLDALIAQDRKDLITPSNCYAYAALAAGCPFINFTPNPGTHWGGLAELAARTRTPFAGDDGKTGETLLKTALAPLFAHRHLRVMSWEGVNLLGNDDGHSLAEPRNRATKIHNKEQVLTGILGYSPHAGVDINYVPSLGDWKTAWDLIHFSGFMDVPMTMQFTWQGCDSVLAAPLVLDMARLADLARRRGESGLMTQLACFFKNPIGDEEMDFHRQFARLLDYAEGCRQDSGTPGRG